MKFFSKVKQWFIDHKPTKRRLIQIYSALLYNANIKGFFTGQISKSNSKLACVPGFNCYSCPGAIGACPLGSLQNALAASGTTAPMYVIGIILLFGLLLGRTICGFLCPVGLLQELAYKIKTPKVKKGKVTRVLSYLKYVLLIGLVICIPVMYQAGVPAFCKYICPVGTLEGGIGILANPNNENMLSMLGPLFTWKFLVLVAIIVACIFIYRFFCRFLCPLGAIYGFFNKISILGVKLDKNKCTDCGLCVAHCKMDINHVGDHECISCGDCIKICPANAISWKGSKLFIHPNAIDTTPVKEEKVNLLAMASKVTEETVLEEGATAQSENTVGADSANISENTGIYAQTSEISQGDFANDKTVSDDGEKPTLTPEQKIKKRNFWLEFSAWAVALVILAGALVYYNFILKDEAPVTNLVGQECPEFTVELLDDFSEYSPSDSRGKITILNFWYTDCAPCVAELPHFEELYEDFGEDIYIVALHSYGFSQIEQGSTLVEDYIYDCGWDSWNINFAIDVPQQTEDGQKEIYDLMGGSNGSYPMTVIVDQEGVIVFHKIGSVTYDELEKQINDLLQ